MYVFVLFVLLRRERVRRCGGCCHCAASAGSGEARPELVESVLTTSVFATSVCNLKYVLEWDAQHPCSQHLCSQITRVQETYVPKVNFSRSTGERTFVDAEGKWAWLYSGNRFSGISLECPVCVYTRDLHYDGNFDLVEARARLIRWCRRCTGSREAHKALGKSPLLNVYRS